MTRRLAVALLTLVLLAGCSGTPPGASGSVTRADTTTDATVDLPSNETASERALDAERQRIERVVANTSGIDDLAFSPTGGPQEARATNRTENGVVVSVVVAIGYRSSCVTPPAEDMNAVTYVDGWRVRTTYVVTVNETQLRTVEKPLPDGC